MALIRPARSVPDALVVAVAARDRARAQAFATKHDINRVHDSYDALLADPEIEAIYNPLPNSLHCEWSIKALEAGKHVLCEKPIASNADEAGQMADAATRTGRVLMEAFHYRYHPLAARMKAVVDGGDLGTVRHIETHMCIPLPFPNDIRYRWNLAGGATMDVGCYTISLLRFLAGAEPEVTRAQAVCSSEQVDRYMEANFRFADGRTGRIVCSLFSSILLRFRAVVRGDGGEMRVINPIAPQFWHRLTVKNERGRTSERVSGDATYTHQLRAFLGAVRDGTPVPNDPADGIANMRVIDAVYRAAGLKPRGT
jgi:predicted dehydrogenase